MAAPGSAGLNLAVRAFGILLIGGLATALWLGQPASLAPGLGGLAALLAVAWGFSGQPAWMWTAVGAAMFGYAVALAAATPPLTPAVLAWGGALFLAAELAPLARRNGPSASHLARSLAATGLLTLLGAALAGLVLWLASPAPPRGLALTVAGVMGVAAALGLLGLLARRAGLT